MISPVRARLVVVLLAAGAFGALAAGLATSAPKADPMARAGASQSVDALRATLLRCQALGDAALGDAGCRAAWAEHRRRFLGVDALRETRP